MGRPKKTLKVKEPIRIRERKLANGNTSLYLDIYQKGTRKYESLNLYLIPANAPDAKLRNAETRAIAEKIKADRIIALQGNSIKHYDKIKRSSISLIDFLKEYENDSFGFSQSTLKGRCDMRKKVEEYLDEEGLSYIGIKDVTPDFCRGFLKFLATAKNSVAKYHEGRTINEGCAHHHQAVWNGALNRAVRDGLIIGNPMKALDKREKFQPGNGDEREYLTIEELRKLMDTPCTNEQVKKAFIFACFAGLRLSDVRSLAWNKIFKTSDGETLYVHTMMQKTQKIVNVPLSNEALRCLEKKKDPNELLFVLPTSDATINYHIKKWMKKAEINKKISFHCSRHTFATMMITLGADIFTTSKLLGHANITTTQIYSKIIDKKKVEAVNLVDNLFTTVDKVDETATQTTEQDS